MSDWWPRGRQFPSPFGTVGPPEKSFSTASDGLGNPQISEGTPTGLIVDPDA
jgi:hypothetical protein